MPIRNRIRKAHLNTRHRLDRRTSHSQTRRLFRAMYPDPASKMASSVFLVGKRPPLAQYPLIWRWLARLVYKQINWCPDYGIEYQGVYDNEVAARFAASAPGMFYMELPFNAELPERTAQFGIHDFPHSEASSEYRHRKFPYVTISRDEFEALDTAVSKTLDCAQGRCRPAAV